jgi:hypothetical protein
MKRRNKLILEFTEFNAQRLNPDSAQMAVNVDNPQLSVNAFDRHEDAIRNGVSRINSILQSLSNTSAFRNLKSKLALETQQIKSLKILRIVKINNISYDVYINFIVDDCEYFGVVENVLSREPIFKSEIFKDFGLVQSKEWIIRTKGLVIKTLKQFFKIEEGKYKLLNDQVICYSNDTGRMAQLKKGAEVEVIRCYDNKILIKYENDFYNLLNDNFIYFNYWFEPIH